MRPGGCRRWLDILCVPLLMMAGPALAQQLPSGFVLEDAAPGAGFQEPTCLAFTPDGRILVGEKAGRVWVIQGSAKVPDPMWKDTLEVLDRQDAGFTGIAVDPNYAVNRYVYFSYEVNPDSDGVNNKTVSFGRLVRYQTNIANPNVVDKNTRTVLIGATWSSGVPNGGSIHTIDGLRWGADGSLLVSAGDGGIIAPDWGGNYPDLFLPGRIDPYEDIGSFRSQYTGSLCGKVLRINPVTGNGYPSNPYYDGNPTSNRSKVWAYGFRNPWRFSVRPGTGSADPSAGRPGTLYVGNVGLFTWESVDVVKLGGENFGWPCQEGGHTNPGLVNATPFHGGCDSTGTYGDPEPFSAPLLYYNHDDPSVSSLTGMQGGTVIGGLFYQGSVYPPSYRGEYIFGDFVNSDIWIVAPDTTDHVNAWALFDATPNGPVDFAADPFVGDLYYVGIYSNQVVHVRYTTPIAGDHQPSADAEAANATGVAPLAVSFSSDESFDLDDDPIALSWNFGDGTGSVLPNPTHTYTAPGVYQAVLTADDHRGGVNRDTLVVVVRASDGFPTTSILDTFDRPNGPLTGSWQGDRAGLVIADSTLDETGTGNTIAWSAAFGANQEARLRLASLPGIGSGVGLLLKMQDTIATQGAIRVRVDSTTTHLWIETSLAGSGWQTVAGPIAVGFTTDDELGARAYASGQVDALRNGTVVASASVRRWAWAGSGGRIGLEVDGANASRLDDFGGGTIDITTPLPDVSILSPATPRFYAAGDTIALSGSGSGPGSGDSGESLNLAWSVDAVVGSTVYPDAFVASGASAAFVPLAPSGAPGEHHLIRLAGSDIYGYTGSQTVSIWPEVDFTPGPVTTTPDTISTMTSTTYRFLLTNNGRAPSPPVHWQIRLDAFPIAEGDTTVAALGTVQMTAVAAPLIIATGTHSLRVVVDSLNLVVESNEGDNTRTRPVFVGHHTTGVETPVVTLAVSPAFPTPTRALATVRLDLPQPSRVRFAVYDVQGREVWRAPERAYAEGRWTLAWEGRAAAGATAPPGLYLARIEAAGHTWVRRIVRIE